ncbi:MAG: hypothetical protein IKN04_00115 [Clostridia bacterium]|nr:hypothetical protein [Clostridia bacterium]MBR6184632.1 hypothetical protein [Clostridia bacterium]
MAKTYDTDFLRTTAATINGAADSISTAVRTTLRWVKEDVPDHLSGSAAEAIEAETADLETRLLEYGASLEGVGATLKRYAFLLDQADQKASEMIESGR